MPLEQCCLGGCLCTGSCHLLFRGLFVYWELSPCLVRDCLLHKCCITNTNFHCSLAPVPRQAPIQVSAMLNSLSCVRKTVWSSSICAGQTKLFYVGESLVIFKCFHNRNVSTPPSLHILPCDEPCVHKQPP